MMENQNVPNHQPDFEDTCLIFCSPTSGIVPKTHHNGPEGVSWYQQPRHQKLCCYCGDAIPFLVGGIPTPLKNMKVSWDDYSQHMGNIFQTTNQF